jgi:hypothetical protein
MLTAMMQPERFQPSEVAGGSGCAAHAATDERFEHRDFCLLRSSHHHGSARRRFATPK